MGRWPDATTRGAAVLAVREDDRKLVRLLSILPVATTAQIPVLAYPGRNRRTITRHLYRLAARGLLANIRIPACSGDGLAARGAALWHLSPAGRQVAAAIWDGDPKRQFPSRRLRPRAVRPVAWAAAAVTEWVTHCQVVGLELGLAIPGAELGWSGWLPGTAGAEPPLLLIARRRHFLRPGAMVSARRLQMYRQIVTPARGAPGPAVHSILVIGWTAVPRNLEPGRFMQNPTMAAAWVKK